MIWLLLVVVVVSSGCITRRSGKYTFISHLENLTVYSQLINTLHTTARVLDGMTLYSPDILIPSDTNCHLSFWCLKTYTCILCLRIHDHSFLTYAIIGNIFFSGGKRRGGPKNTCGLGCSLKSCDLEKLLNDNEEEGGNEVVEHGIPSSTRWKVMAQADKLAVCLMRRKPSLEIWGLGTQIDNLAFSMARQMNIGLTRQP